MTLRRANLLIVASIATAVALSAAWHEIHRSKTSDVPPHAVSLSSAPVADVPIGAAARGPGLPRHAPARRIVSGYTAFTDILTAIGADARIVAATTHDAETLGVISVGSHLQPDVEAILSVKPDLVLLASPRPDVAPAIEQRLTATGATVFCARPRSVAETLALIETLGQLTDCRPRAERLVADARRTLAALSNVVNAIADAHRPRVFVEVRSAPSLLTARSDSVTCDMIRLAGGRPVCVDSGKMTPLDIETLLKADPDFYIQQVGAMNSHPDNPARHPVIGTLHCLKAGRFAQLDETALSRPGPHVAEVVVELHGLLLAGWERGTPGNRSARSAPQ